MGAVRAPRSLQVALGISTLLLVVPIPLAAAHQAGAVLLLTAAIALPPYFAPGSTDRRERSRAHIVRVVRREEFMAEDGAFAKKTINDWTALAQRS